MRLAVSNIAWEATNDELMYHKLLKYGYDGLEIAPSRIFTESPYENLESASNWLKSLQENFSLIVPSMQSIWYGRSEKLFGSSEEQCFLLEYTKKAIDFASVIGCRNLVFGCPKNRVLMSKKNYEQGIEFFHSIAEYAENRGTIIGIEANPTIYNTNYINTTKEALALIKEVGRPGLRLNLDIGTMIANNEQIEILTDNVHLISHVHISEPYLKPIEKRHLHRELAELLQAEGYANFVSIEMGKVDDLTILYGKMAYIKEIFS